MAIQARTEFAAALNQLASEKGVDVSVVIEAIQQAALAAFRKDLSLRGEAIPEDFEELQAEIDPVTGEISIMRDKDNITPPGFARIAAQTAKQVIMQRLHEAEKNAVMGEFEQKVGTVVSGTLQRQEGNTYFIDLGRAEGVLPPSEQTRDEYYHPNQRLKVYIKEIREGRRGPEVVVSRCDPALVKGLFALEVPEIQTGSVVIKDIAREAGSRSKIAAVSTVDGVDSVGSLVGQKGVRVQAVMNELGEERIDIISYSEDPARYIAAALSPAKEVQVTLEDKDGLALPTGGEKVAKVKVPATSLSLAIGKGGQNVRLAAKLTGWKIDIEGTGEGTKEVKEDIGAAPITNPVVDQVEEEIDKATAEESINGATEPEPSAEEAAPAAAVAEADIAQEDAQKKSSDEEVKSLEETEDAQRGDLIGDKQPSEAELAPVETAQDTDQGEPEEKNDKKSGNSSK